MDLKVSSTIGFELEHNDLLRTEDEDRFVERALAALGPQPPNFKAIVAINRGPLVGDGVDAHPLAPRQLEQKRAEGALVVDVRTMTQFDEAHVPDSISITMLRAGFGSRLAWIADRDQEIVYVGRDDEDGRLAADLAASVGIRTVGGFLAGGMTSWREEGRPTERIERMTVEQLRERSQRDPALQILDVREASEWQSEHIPGSIHVPYHDIHEMPDEVDARRPIAAICSSGQRSGVAASLLQRLGADEVLHVVPGGVKTWGRAGYPIER
jgi:hydroxyacylglutathione hydrolase